VLRPVAKLCSSSYLLTAMALGGACRMAYMLLNKPIRVLSSLLFHPPHLVKFCSAWISNLISTTPPQEKTLLSS
jgi:hypothetical protein